MQLQIREENPGAKARILVLKGSIDAATQESLDARGRTLAAEGICHLLLEVSGLDYVSSSGVSCLFQMRSQCRNRGGSFGLYRPSLSVRRVLEILKLEDWLWSQERMPEKDSPFFTYVAQREAERPEPDQGPAEKTARTPV